MSQILGNPLSLTLDNRKRCLGSDITRGESGTAGRENEIDSSPVTHREKHRHDARSLVRNMLALHDGVTMLGTPSCNRFTGCVRTLDTECRVGHRHDSDSH